ncbi:hypothetical protein K1719_037979 [Acacia pycnantha]|nr:hypothetical protein K1719_037979 [Acacia pycnantha]
MLANNSLTPEPFPCADNGTITTNKRKRRPAGTPDPDAEVVSLSPKTLLESDRYVCEICNQGFQRDQNLQMHRRRHKVPWKLLKRETPAARKRVFVCPEPTCLHHDPATRSAISSESRNTSDENTATTNNGSVNVALKATPFSLIIKLISKLVAPEATLAIVVAFSPGWRALSNTKMLVTWGDSGRTHGHFNSSSHRRRACREPLRARVRRAKPISALV